MLIRLHGLHVLLASACYIVTKAWSTRSDIGLQYQLQYLNRDADADARPLTLLYAGLSACSGAEDKLCVL